MCGRGRDVCTFLPHSANVTWFSCLEERSAGLHSVDRVSIESSNPTCPFVTIYLPQYVPKRTKNTSTLKPVGTCSWQHYSKQPESGNSPESYQVLNGKTKFGISLQRHFGLPWWLSGKKKSASQCWRLEFNPWVRKITWRRKCQPTLAFLPGKSHRQRRLAGYGAWGHKESDTPMYTMSIYSAIKRNEVPILTSMLQHEWTLITLC